MKTVQILIGTRPEAIKMCPLVKELQTRYELDVRVGVTGQHREMLNEVLEVFRIAPTDILGAFSDGKTLTELYAVLLWEIGHLLQNDSPDLVLVHGDTASSFAGAMAAFLCGIPVGHVEAGLRSGRLDAPFPEELNRKLISEISVLDFAPTLSAREHLLRMGKPEDKIFLTGNTVVDALKETVRSDFHHPLLDRTAGKRILFFTCHRRENLGEPIRRIFYAVQRLLDLFSDICVIFPLHKNPSIRTAVKEVFGDRVHPRMYLCEPFSVIDCHNLLSRSTLVLTDSGGLQEEAPAFGIPVLVLRETTERSEGLTAGGAILCGTDEERIVSITSRFLNDPVYYASFAKKRSLYGDGNASRRIADTVCRFLSISI